MIKRILLLGAFALVTGAVVRLGSAPAPADPLASAKDPAPNFATPPLAADEGAHPHWRLVWSHPAPDIRDAALDADGTTIAWVDKRGSVRRMVAATGQTVWQSAPSPSSNANWTVAAAPHGAIIAWARWNPQMPDVKVYSPTVGKEGAPALSSQHPMEGAVWSVTPSANGDRAFVGTGHRRLYVLPLPIEAPRVPPVPQMPAPPLPHTAPAKPSPVSSTPPTSPTPSAVSVSLPGIPDAIAIAARSPLAVVGTWEETGVSAWDTQGALHWRHDERDPARNYDIHVSADGSTVVAVSARRPHGTNAQVYVWDARTGRLIWSRDLNASDAHALIDAQGDRIAVSFAVAPPEGAADSESGVPAQRKVVLFDREGHRLFADKGGMYFVPRLIALSADGARITVRDNAGYLWILDDKGRMQSRLRLPLDPATGAPPTIRETYASADGTSLLIRCGDGELHYLKLSAP